MKQFYIMLFIAAMLFSNKAKAQITVACDSVYEKVDELPRYENDSGLLMSYLTKDLMKALSKCIYRIEDAPSRLLIDFVIEKDGTIIDVNFRKSGLNKDCELQLKERLLKMRGWIPGKINGKPVCSKFYLPISCIKWVE